ncbi:MAG: caspase family protein [Candidatus Delongbacteria bacterium]|nr:caspase family protein [Candidatus Delongbacteria bacterium]
MHYLFTTITILLLTLQILFASEKRALVVAVGNYHEDSGWSKLSAQNDADLMVALLEKQGFKPINIAILQDDKATKNGVLKALDNLITQTKENDIVLFHFSGHGQQISDLNGDELNGYDEAIIPYDAYLLPSVHYQGENHIIDDELNIYLHKLREKTGPNGDVLIILDACHSGTATRNTNNTTGYRGTPLRFELEKNNIQTQKNEQQGYDEQTTNSPGLSPYVVISASGQNQLNKEITDEQGNAYGSLSFALYRTLSTSNQKISYQALFDNIRNEMCIAFRGKHFQTPQIEGNTRRLIFAGQQTTIPPYFSVLEQVNSTKIIINGGSLSGLTEGSLIDFYTADSAQPKNQNSIAKGIISRLGLSKSEVKFDTAVENIVGTWGFLKQLNNPENYESVSEMRADVLRKAKSSAPNIQVEIELIPLNSNKERISKTFKTGEQFHIKAINKGTQRAFFQIIGIQPDNEVLLITDLSILSPNDFIIDAGDTILIDAFTLTACKPAGLEMYKVVASKEQLDLSPIKTMQNSQKRFANLTEFEHLLNDLFVHERSVKTFRFENDITIFNYTFTVLEK